MQEPSLRRLARVALTPPPDLKMAVHVSVRTQSVRTCVPTQSVGTRCPNSLALEAPANIQPGRYRGPRGPRNDSARASRPRERDRSRRKVGCAPCGALMEVAQVAGRAGDPLVAVSQQPGVARARLPFPQELVVAGPGGHPD